MNKNIETLINYGIGLLIVFGLTFGLGYIGYKLTEYYYPCCYNSCQTSVSFCLLPTITVIIGLFLGLGVIFRVDESLKDYRKVCEKYRR